MCTIECFLKTLEFERTLSSAGKGPLLSADEMFPFYLDVVPGQSVSNCFALLSTVDFLVAFGWVFYVALVLV